MNHVQIDPKAVLAGVAAEQRLAHQAQALQRASDPMRLRDLNRGARFVALLTDGNVIEGRRELAPIFRDAVGQLCGRVSYRRDVDTPLQAIEARHIESVEVLS